MANQGSLAFKLSSCGTCQPLVTCATMAGSRLYKARADSIVCIKQQGQNACGMCLGCTCAQYV